MDAAVTIATPPAGFLRHPVSGCIIPRAELDAHEVALSSRAARHSLAPKGSVHLDELARTKVRLQAELEVAELEQKLAAARAGSNAKPAPEASTEAPGAVTEGAAPAAAKSARKR